MERKKTPPWNGLSPGPMIVPCRRERIQLDRLASSAGIETLIVKHVVVDWTGTAVGWRTEMVSVRHVA